jgi:hypothetical protein
MTPAEDNNMLEPRPNRGVVPVRTGGSRARRFAMNVDPAEQVFEEILPYLETLAAQIGV